MAGRRDAVNRGAKAANGCSAVARVAAPSGARSMTRQAPGLSVMERVKGIEPSS